MSHQLWMLVGLALCAASQCAYSIERISVQGGAGNYVDVVGIGVGSSDWKRWVLGDKWSVSVYGLGRLDYWRGNSNHVQNSEVVDLSAAPVLRLERAGDRSLQPFIEASIGFHLLSHTQINETRDFSTAFQFGEFLGAGVSFGSTHQYEIELRLQHVSNGGIRNPNDGLTYGSLVVQYHLPQR